jgi:uncharacterized membrane protein
VSAGTGEVRPRGDAMDKGRSAAFTDGVFAIAITLLVLEIRVPDLHPAAGRTLDAAMREFLGTLGVPLLAFALSFASVGVVWLNHHATFARIRYVDRTGNMLNLLQLAIVCFIPFPTALLARYGALPSSTAFYGATFTALSIAYMVNWQYAVRAQHAVDPRFPVITFRRALPGVIGTAMYAAGTLIAFVLPVAAVAIFVTLAVYYMLPGVFGRQYTIGPER